MATIIERIVEPVIENPVVDILAEPDKGSAVASRVPALNLGPVTELVGKVRDQAELAGLLNSLYELHQTPCRWSV